MHDSLTDRHQINYAPYTEAQRQEVRQQVQQFLASPADGLDPLQLLSLRHITEILSAAKVSSPAAGHGE